MKIPLISALVLLIASISFSQDAAEVKVQQKPLIVYSGGLSAGSLFALNDELADESQQYLKLSLSNIFAVRPHVDLFLDFNWFAPGSNFGGDLGFDYLFSRSDFSPLMGFGVGAHYFDKENQNFGATFGASATVHLGFIMDLTDNLVIRVRVPYHVVFNNDMDHGAGLDIGFLLASKFRHIKKLTP